MTTTTPLKKAASAAAVGVGGLLTVGASTYGVLRAEAKLARRAIGDADAHVADAAGWYGRGRPGPAVTIALLGDSTAAGYGVPLVEQTPGALLASGVAAGADRRVHLRTFGVVGAKSSDLAAQVDRALLTEPDVAVVLIGANDVTHVVLPAVAVRHLAEAVRRLAEGGVAVVVGTSPDLGTVRPIAQPLRFMAKVWSRRLAAVQAVSVVEAGGRTVSLASILGPEFDAQPGVFFGPDRFHPSAAGYAALAGVLVPSTLAALGLAPEHEAQPAPLRGEGVRSVREAAVEASHNPGTELEATEVGGAKRGPGGRWVTLMRRRRPTVDGESPAQEPADGSDDDVSGG